MNEDDLRRFSDGQFFLSSFCFFVVVVIVFSFLLVILFLFCFFLLCKICEGGAKLSGRGSQGPIISCILFDWDSPLSVFKHFFMSLRISQCFFFCLDWMVTGSSRLSLKKKPTVKPSHWPLLSQLLTRRQCWSHDEYLTFSCFVFFSLNKNNYTLLAAWQVVRSSQGFYCIFRYLYRN